MAEYAVLIGIVAAALLAMQIYAKRGLQAGLKTAADQIGSQADGIRYESGERLNRRVIIPGTVLDRQSAVKSTVSRTITERELAGGARQRTITRDATGTAGALSGGASSVSQVVVERRR